MEKIICFHVVTKYKSGRKKEEGIFAFNEKHLWDFYYKHHNNKLIQSCNIICHKTFIVGT